MNAATFRGGSHADVATAGAASFLQTVANAGNDGYLIPGQAWDRANQYGSRSARRPGRRRR
jgi:hypothetical protein